MDQALAFVIANWLVIALTIAGIIATVLVYRRSQRVKRPSWSVHTADLVTKRTADLQGLTVLFNGTLVSDLSVSRIVLFNAGADPIRRSDIAPAARLAIEVPSDVTMLDATLVSVNNSINQVEVQFDPITNRALVEFDYLDKDEGAVFDVVHYGGTQPTASVTGVVIGAEPLKHLSIDVPDPYNRRFGVGAGVVAVVALIYFAVQVYTHGWSWGYLAILIFAAVPGLMFLSIFEVSVPKGLEAFHERRYRRIKSPRPTPLQSSAK